MQIQIYQELHKAINRQKFRLWQYLNDWVEEDELDKAEFEAMIWYWAWFYSYEL